MKYPFGGVIVLAQNLCAHCVVMVHARVNIGQIDRNEGRLYMFVCINVIHDHALNAFVYMWNFKHMHNYVHTPCVWQ